MSVSEAGSGEPVRTGPTPGDNYKWLAFAAVGSNFVTGVLALSMVFVALPVIADDFGVTLEVASWVVISASLTISALLLPFGRLADLVGRRRVHLIGLVLFAIGAALHVVVDTFALLIVARVVLSVGGALTESVSTGILVSVFGDHERGKAIAAQTTAVAIGAASGPLAAGVALQFLSWRALFVFIFVLTIVTFGLGWRILDEARISRSMPERRPFDWIGAGLSALVIVLVVLTINNPLGLAWRSWPMAVAVVAIAVLLTAFIRWELASPHPMLQLRFFAIRTFRLAVIARICGFVSATAVFILVPIFLVSIRGFSEGRAGIALFLNSVGLGVSAQIAGRLSDRFGTRPFMIGGFLAKAGVMVAFSTMTLTTPLWVVSVVALAAGLAMGCWNVPNNATVLGTVPPSSYGVVGAFTNLARNVGNVFGQATVAAVVTGVLVARNLNLPLGDLGDTPGGGDAFVAGWRAAFLLAGGLLLVAATLAMLIRPAEPARPEGD